MSLSNIQCAIQAALEAANPTFSGVRQAGAVTPCYVYEITSAAIDMTTAGIPALCHWTMTVQIEAIADTVDDCLTLIEDVRGIFDSPVTDTTYDCVLVLSAFQRDDEHRINR